MEMLPPPRRRRETTVSHQRPAEVADEVEAIAVNVVVCGEASAATRQVSIVAGTGVVSGLAVGVVSEVNYIR